MAEMPTAISTSETVSVASFQRPRFQTTRRPMEIAVATESPRRHTRKPATMTTTT